MAALSVELHFTLMPVQLFVTKIVSVQNLSRYASPALIMCYTFLLRAVHYFNYASTFLSETEQTVFLLI